MSGSARHSSNRLACVVPYHLERQVMFLVQFLDKIYNAFPGLYFDSYFVSVDSISESSDCESSGVGGATARILFKSVMTTSMSLVWVRRDQEEPVPTARMV